MSDGEAGRPRPLCVDLDGTLVATDCLWESVLLLMKRQPLSTLALPLWTMSGRPVLKRKLAERVLPDAATLPYRAEVLDAIKAAKAAERRVLLVTASDQKIADAVGQHLGLFDEVIGSDGVKNLKGPEKAALLVERFGKGQFDYIGDSSADAPLWAASHTALVAAPRASTLELARRNNSQVETVGPPAKGRLKAAVKALRPHQWSKNILLFVAAILAHIDSLAPALMLLAGFFAFSFTASSVYVLNDLLDLEQDRVHRTKKRRPFASGLLSIPFGLAMFPAVLLSGILLSVLFLPPAFTAALLGYFVLTTAYSFYLKRKLIVDVLALGGLFTYRVLAGGLAAGVTVSFWLLAFSLFFFTGLAFAKRFSELVEAREKDLDRIPGRNYWVADFSIITSVGPSCGLMAVLVFCLYIRSPEVLQLYKHPEVLWLIVPVLMYWNTRIWFLAARDQMHDDPVVFALRDKNSYLAGVVAGACLLAATQLG